MSRKPHVGSPPDADGKDHDRASNRSGEQRDGYRNLSVNPEERNANVSRVLGDEVDEGHPEKNHHYRRHPNTCTSSAPGVSGRLGVVRGRARFVLVVHAPPLRSFPRYAPKTAVWVASESLA